MSPRLTLVLLLTLCPSLALAAGERCPDASGLRSADWSVSTSLAFANRMPVALRNYWLNYNGLRQFYAIVRPGQNQYQQTYVAPPWVFTDADDDCVSVDMLVRESGHVVATGENAAAQQQTSGSGAAQAGRRQEPADALLAGTWLALQAGVRFPLGCDSGEPVRYSASGAYSGPGARGTWQLKDGALTEVVYDVDAEADDNSVKIGEPYTSRITWKNPDTFVKTFRGGFQLTFRRCPFTTATAVDACVEKSCTGKSAGRSKGKEDLVREQIAAACERKDGTIDPASVIERDLNGDGQADLIIHHHGIQCSDGSRSLFCGAQACSFQIYVSRGGSLALSGEFMGVETIKIDGERVPTIRTFAHGGKPTAVRWNGREFRPR